jgi:hypothetical protein
MVKIFTTVLAQT